MDSKQDFDTKLRVCNNNNLLVAVRESENFYEVDGIVFNRQTNECLGTIFQLEQKNFVPN